MCLPVAARAAFSIRMFGDRMNNFGYAVEEATSLWIIMLAVVLTGLPYMSTSILFSMDAPGSGQRGSVLWLRATGSSHWKPWFTKVVVRLFSV